MLKHEASAPGRIPTVGRSSAGSVGSRSTALSYPTVPPLRFGQARGSLEHVRGLLGPDRYTKHAPNAAFSSSIVARCHQ